MAATFYFYDLETSGISPREGRVMQFAGQRTDLELNPIGEPNNVLIKLTPDALPEPEAVLVTGITPQQTIADGITEAEFLKLFYGEVAVPDTIFVGFNSIRFDDEFMRFLNYRNFHDAYEWQWQDGRSRWDILDLSRMTRALRPEGIEWPFDSDGKPSNRLGLLTAVNKLEHTDAHDALSDVKATIAVARLIYNKQTKLFNYLLKMRGKNEVVKLVGGHEPFVYTSGRYPGDYEKTTVAAMVTENPKQGAVVWDLRHDPKEWQQATPEALAKAWLRRRDEEGPQLPVKTLKYNRSPAVAPLGVLDSSSKKRLKLDMKQIEVNYKTLTGQKDLPKRLDEALKLMDKQRQASFMVSDQEVDAQLYDGFMPDSDKTTMSAIRAASPDQLSGFGEHLKDERLKALLPLYKARNFPQSLSSDERQAWDKFVHDRLLGGPSPTRLERYFLRLEELANTDYLTESQRFLLEELQLYGQSLTQ